MVAFAVGAFGWLVFAARSASAVEAGMCVRGVVGVRTYPTYRGVEAAAVLVAKLLAQSALV